MKKLIFTSLLFCFLTSSFAQDPAIGATANQGAALMLPLAYDDKYSTQEQQNVQFVSYPYQSSRIDLRDFRKNYPKANLPDYLEVVPPGFANPKEVIILMGMPAQKEQSVDDVIIWLVQDYGKEEVTFYTDSDLDRNFNNNEAPLIVEAGADPIKVQMAPYTGAKPYFLNIVVPEVPVPSMPRLTRTHVLGSRNRLLHQFAFGPSATFGVGQLRYSYDNLDLGFPTTYDVDLTGKGIGATINYNARRFRIGLTATIQNLNFYTSYLRVRVDDPEIIVDPNTGIRKTVDNVEIYRNIDNHSNNIIFWSFDLALRSYIGRTFELHPYVSVGLTSFLANEYVSDIRFDEVSYELPASKTAELGLRMEFSGRNNRAFFAGFGVNRIWWEPTDFLAEIPNENFSERFLTYRISVGYLFGL